MEKESFCKRTFLKKYFLKNVFKNQLNGHIQEAYVARELYEQLADPKYTDNGAIFDIMAYTVVEQGIELAMAA